MDDITAARMKNSPDYDVDIHITGVRVGNTGKAHWNIAFSDEWAGKEELLAEVLDRVAEVLRQPVE